MIGYEFRRAVRSIISPFVMEVNTTSKYAGDFRQLDTSNGYIFRCRDSAGTEIMKVTKDGMTLGSSTKPGHIVISGTMSGADVNLVNHSPFGANPTTNDQIGTYHRIYGVLSDFSGGSNASPVVCAGTFDAAPQFSFVVPKGGNVLGVEAQVDLQGSAAGGDFTGSLRGAYAHVEVTGNGNGTTIGTIYGFRADIGMASSGSGYTVSDAISIYAGSPTPANIGTLTRTWGMFSEDRVGIGGTTTTPIVEIVPSNGAIISRQVGTTGYRWTVNVAGGVGLMIAYDDVGAGYLPLHCQGSSVAMLDANANKRFEINSTGVGYFATAPATQQTVTGSRGGNAALASLLTGLATYGLIVDSSSA